MPNIHLHIDNFNAGELSPLLGARFAVEKVMNGCRQLRNFIPHVHGPAFRRPGMQYIGDAIDGGEKSSLRGFNFSTSTGFVLELHPDGLQVWSNGQQVPLQQPVILGYTEQECMEVQMAQVNDTCYLTHPNHPPKQLIREADDKWKIEDIPWTWPALGDENARNDEVATPVTTELLSVPCHEWAEFKVFKDKKVTLTVNNPSTATNKKKVARLQIWTANGWKNQLGIGWNDSPPADPSKHWTPNKDYISRITYVGPEQPSSSITATWPGQSPEELAGATLDTTVPQPATAVPVPAPEGEWQVTLTSPTEIPDGKPRIHVEKFKNGKWIAEPRVFKKKQWHRVPIYAKAGETVPWRGKPLDPSFTEVRLVWKGRAMSEGVMKIEKITFPESKSITLAVSETFGNARTLTATADIFVPAYMDETVTPPREVKGHVGSYWQIVHRRESSFKELVMPSGNFPNPEADRTTGALRVQGAWEVYSYGTWIATLYLEKKVNGEWEIIRSWASNKDRNVIANGNEENEVELRLRVSDGEGFAANGVGQPRFTLEAADARVYGLVQITSVGKFDEGTMVMFADKAARLANPPTSVGQIGFQDDTNAWYEGKERPPRQGEGPNPVKYWEPKLKLGIATANVITTVHSTDPTTLWTEGAWSDVNGYPRSVTLHGQRLWFGGTRKEPLRLWGSVVNDYVNFRRSTFDDGSVSFTPAAQQANALQWMASFGEDLVLGTSGDEWTLSGGTERGPITPTSVLMQRRSGYGSRYLPAVLMGEVVTFVQRGGRKVRQVAPRADGIVWSAADLTVLAEHVGRKGIIQMAAMTFPFTILWAVTEDGKLLGMTHETEQNVFAWHVHETDGKVESVAVVLGVESDEVWLSVLRNGQRNIERLDPKIFGLRFDELASLCYADGAVKFALDAPASVLTGLTHLNGKEVVVLGDGAELTPRMVLDGQITLEKEVSVAVVGLPYESRLQPMRRDLNLQDGTAQHRQWKTTGVGLHLYETLACQVADAPEMRFESVQFRSVSTPMGSAPALFSGDKDAGVQGRTRQGIDVVVKSSAPLPLNVAGITWKGDVSGE